MLYLGGVGGIYQLVVDPGLGSEITTTGALVGTGATCFVAAASFGWAGWLLFAFARHGRGSLWPIAPLSVAGEVLAIVCLAFSLACCSGG